MGVTHKYSLLIMLILLGLGTSPLAGQLQFPGSPMGDRSKLKAADVMYVLPPLDPLQIESANQSSESGFLKSYQFAMERGVDLTPESHGSWESFEGYRIWRVHIVSPGAHSLGLVFNSYRLEKGVSLFVYNPDKTHIKGALTSGNNKSSGVLPVGHLPGEELIIEMQVPFEISDYGEIRVESVSHAFKDAGQNSVMANCPAGEFGCSQACMLDVNCEEGADWQLTKRSVVRVYTTTLYCSGVLINNSAYDGTPYILTAEHCINKQYYADRTVFQFNYESPTCFGSDGPLNMSIAGAELITVGDSIDFSLLELSLTPPDDFDVYYAGWDRSDFQTTATATLHHPWGDVKKITNDYEAPTITTKPSDVPYNDLDDYHYFSFWWILKWDEGSTQGGSSGSPLFNADQRVIGILSGGVAACGDSIGYDYEKERVIYNQAFNYDDYYTRFSMSWDFNGESGPSLKPWLDPGNTGVTVLGGYTPIGVEPKTQPSRGHFTLFPNPVGDRLYISAPYDLNDPISYKIYKLSGALVREGILYQSASNQIETTFLTEGIYVVQLQSNPLQEVHKIVITR